MIVFGCLVVSVCLLFLSVAAKGARLPINTATTIMTASTSPWHQALKVGSRIDALDLQNRWFIATVVAERASQIQVERYTYTQIHSENGDKCNPHTYIHTYTMKTGTNAIHTYIHRYTMKTGTNAGMFSLNARRRVWRRMARLRRMRPMA